MNTKIVSIAVGVTLSIILIGAVVAPVIDDATASDIVAYTNQIDEKYLFSLDLDGGEHNLEYTANNSTVSVDDNSRNISISQYAILTDTWGISTSSLGLTMNVYTGQQFKNLIDSDVSVTMSEGTATISYGSNTVTKEYSWALVFDPDGDYCSKQLSSGAYINNTGQVVVSEYSGSGYKECMKGVAHISGVSATPTFTATSTANTENQIERITAMTIGDLSVAYAFVPASVDYEPTANNASDALLRAIPLMLLVSVLVGVVSAIALRSRD